MGLWSWRFSVYRNFVKGTWREDSLAGDPEGYVEKPLGLGISFHKGPDGETGSGLIYWEL